MTQLVFNRYEKKYLLPESIYRLLRERLRERMSVDQYGLSTICNIYYDTEDDLLIRRSIEHLRYKEKLRLRSYGVPGKDSRVFLEIKKKYEHIVNKRRIELPLSTAYAYLNLGIRPDAECQILREIDFFLRRYRLRPRLFLAYDRLALYGKEDPEFRLTFDARIRSRRVNVELERGDFGTPLLPDKWYLMESKIQNAAPKWFSEILAELKIYSSSFSKYGNIYKKEHGQWNAEGWMVHRIKDWKSLPYEKLHEGQKLHEEQEDRREMVC